MKSLKGNIFRDLQIFSAVVEFKNYSDAAIKLGIDVSSVSRRIKSLEERLRHQLIVRDGRNLRVTTEGLFLYQEFIQQEQAFNKMLVRRQTTTSVKHKQVINIAIPNGLVEYVLAARIPQYIKNNPEIKLNLTCHNLDANIVAEKYDFVILRHIPLQNQLVIKKLYEPKFHLYCTPAYEDNYGVPKTLNDLSSHLLIHRTRPDNIECESFYASNGKETIALINNSRLGTSSSTTDKNIVMGNHAIVSGTDSLYKTELEQGLIIKVLPDYYFFNDFKGFYLIYDKTTLPGKHVQDLMGFIFGVFHNAEI